MNWSVLHVDGYERMWRIHTLLLCTGRVFSFCCALFSFKQVSLLNSGRVVRWRRSYRCRRQNVRPRRLRTLNYIKNTRVLLLKQKKLLLCMYSYCTYVLVLRSCRTSAALRYRHSAIQITHIYVSKWPIASNMSVYGLFVFTRGGLFRH